MAGRGHGWTSRLWDPLPVRPSGSSYRNTLPIPDEEKEEVKRREEERRARGFGFNPQREPEPEPKLWEGDNA